MKVWVKETKYGTIIFKIKAKGFSYNTAMDWRRNRAKDDYDIVINNPDDYETFLRMNDFDELVLDERSVDEFYNFYDKTSAKLEKWFVDNWWGHDLPDLYKWKVGDDGFLHPLRIVETYGFQYYPKNLSREEAKTLVEDYEDTDFHDVIQGYLNDNPENLKTAKERIKKLEDDVQDVIDGHREEILEEVEDMEPAGLDCGFIHIFPTSKQAKEDLATLKSHTSHPNWLEVRLPIATQSITIKRKAFNKAAKFIRDELGVRLTCQTILD